MDGCMEMPKSFSAATPPHMVQFTSSSDCCVQIQGSSSGGYACCARTADFLVLTL